jgi:hypothetical protein
VACDAGSICNPHYSALFQTLHCPYGTEYTYHINIEMSSLYNRVVEQTCTCVSGTYAHNEQVINILSLTDAIDAQRYQFWEILIPKTRVSISLVYFNNTYVFDSNDIDTIETHHRNMIWLWIVESCGCVDEVQNERCGCIDEEQKTLDVTFSYTNQTESEEYEIQTSFILKSNAEFFKLDSNVLKQKIGGIYDSTFSQSIYNDFKSRISPLSFFENHRYNINIQTCSLCTTGSYCQDGERFACPTNSFSLMGGSEKSSCMCLPGYDGLDCDECLSGFICYGGGVVSNCLNLYTNDVNCPCISGSFRNKTTGRCQPCPRGFYCEPLPPSGSTGIDPVYLQIPIPCPYQSDSNVGSIDINSCMCIQGFFLETGIQECMPCPENKYCTGQQNQITNCPSNSVSAIGSSNRFSCTCVLEGMIAKFNTGTHVLQCGVGT